MKKMLLLLTPLSVVVSTATLVVSCKEDQAKIEAAFNGKTISFTNTLNEIEVGKTLDNEIMLIEGWTLPTPSSSGSKLELNSLLTIVELGDVIISPDKDLPTQVEVLMAVKKANPLVNVPSLVVENITATTAVINVVEGSTYYGNDNTISVSYSLVKKEDSGDFPITVTSSDPSKAVAEIVAVTPNPEQLQPEYGLYLYAIRVTGVAPTDPDKDVIFSVVCEGAVFNEKFTVKVVEAASGKPIENSQS
ncbi:Vmc-like lipoprotein signal peptide domain-containing protein [Mesoplasma corruscae]|uniref:Spiralin n=1 Tax=Mesoplasma corruscae TaxID=216874 RepID=A0A2S5RHA4_9MOLU|nr:hypothetical protein [Mesoplasma corruscae]PPE06719.1 hypothetical protein MCORR_v1c03500 [Mesoplasma corruscae]